jgi:prepilin-type processing-associated H-X9-DG protein/prepilin-type N-terminal cleavage/methylation domain-containing protein
MKRFGTRRTAFTLVELLVVIGIIALLISILLPTLSRARDSAKGVKCQSNLRQIGVSVVFYANDFQGFLLPYEQLGVPLDDNPASTIDRHWGAILVDSGAVETETAKGGASGSANESTDVENIFRCPEGIERNWSAEGSPEPTGHDAATGDYYWLRSTSDGRQVPVWYGANGSRGRTGADFRGMWPLGHEEFRVPTSVDPSGEVVEMHKLVRVPNVTKMALFYDGIVAHDRNARRITTRHRNRTQTNVLLADGHVEAFSDETDDITDPRGDLPDQDEFALDRPDYLSLHYPELYWNLMQRE